MYIYELSYIYNVPWTSLQNTPRSKHSILIESTCANWILICHVTPDADFLVAMCGPTYWKFMWHYATQVVGSWLKKQSFVLDFWKKRFTGLNHFFRQLVHALDIQSFLMRRCFFCVFGVSEYLFTQGVWNPRDGSCLLILFCFFLPNTHQFLCVFCTQKLRWFLPKMS